MKQKIDAKKRLKNVFKFLLNPLLRRLGDIQKRIDVLEEQNTNFRNQLVAKGGQNAILNLENKIDIVSKKNNELDQFVFNDVRNILYFHAGSGNHGCEAIVRSLTDIIKLRKNESLLCSYRPEEDRKFGINEIIKYIKHSNLNSSEFDNISFMDRTISFSIGGDNYCYSDDDRKRLHEYNRLFNKKGVKTALIGCSIEEEIINQDKVLDDLNSYSLITARESVTYNALLNAGINKNTHLIPDSAFVLDTIKNPLPNNFIENNTIGLNLSNLISTYSESKEVIYENYVNLVKYIVEKTKYNVALIPHVVQENNDDLLLLYKIYDEFRYSERVVFIDDCNAMELKGYISRCKMFIGARTHAIIAAYSSFVPTVAVGYSVKSKGIAKDIFGTDVNYVLPVQSLKNDNDLINSFLWLEKNYVKIKNHLESFMPDYVKKCYFLKQLVDELRNKKSSLLLASKNVCTGCGACASVCPIECIRMVGDENGFKYPITDYKRCNNCDLCKKVCPTNKDLIFNKHENAYAVKSKDLRIRLKSSSGGVFSFLAEETLKRKGVVFGAGFNSLNKVVHMEIKNIEYLSKLRGSKYVQSDLRDSYKKVEKYLKEKKEVLFSGTPCQILGLKKYLGKDYQNLLCVDIICHGVPSPKIFKKHLKNLGKEYKSKVVLVNFRSKDDGWSNYKIVYTFASKKIIKFGMTEDKFMKSFLENLTLRESCYNCFSKNFKSGSDITLGDYWGIDSIHPEFNDDKGVSVVLLNSEKGKFLFEKIKNKIDFLSSDINIAMRDNPSITNSVPFNKNRYEFFRNFYKSE